MRGVMQQDFAMGIEEKFNWANPASSVCRLYYCCLVVVVVVVVLCYEDDIDRYQIRREQRDKDEVGVRELTIRMAD